MESAKCTRLETTNFKILIPPAARVSGFPTEVYEEALIGSNPPLMETYPMQEYQPIIICKAGAGPNRGQC